MKKFISRVQDLSQKAAHLKAAAQRAPAQVRDLRESVLATAGEFQQLRSDVQSSVSGLRADSEEHLLRALAELNDSIDIFAEAGYDMEGVDLELSPVQRLIVHLRKFEDVSEAGLELLLAAISGRRTAHAVLASLIKAEQLADRVSLTNLVYRELTIYVGPVPTVRLCWRPEDLETEPEPAQASAVVSAPATWQPPPLPGLGESSFFEPRRQAATVPANPAGVVASVVASAPVAAPQETATPNPALGGDWKRSALNRFKKMPDLNKPRG